MQVVVLKRKNPYNRSKSLLLTLLTRQQSLFLKAQRKLNFKKTNKMNSASEINKVCLAKGEVYGTQWLEVGLETLLLNHSPIWTRHKHLFIRIQIISSKCRIKINRISLETIKFYKIPFLTNLKKWCLLV